MYGEKQYKCRTDYSSVFDNIDFHKKELALFLRSLRRFDRYSLLIILSVLAPQLIVVAIALLLHLNSKSPVGNIIVLVLVILGIYLAKRFFDIPKQRMLRYVVQASIVTAIVNVLTIPFIYHFADETTIVLFTVSAFFGEVAALSLLYCSS